MSNIDVSWHGFVLPLIAMGLAILVIWRGVKKNDYFNIFTGAGVVIAVLLMFFNKQLPPIVSNIWILVVMAWLLYEVKGYYRDGVFTKIEAIGCAISVSIIFLLLILFF